MASTFVQQVARAFIGELDLRELGSAAFAEVRQSWHDPSVQCLERTAGAQVEVSRPKKRPRLKSLEVLWAYDNWFRLHTGKGLERFLIKDDW